MNYPQLVDFGLCPVAEQTFVTFDLANTTSNDVQVQLNIPSDCTTLTIEPQEALIAGGKVKTFRAIFQPTEAVVLDRNVKVTFGEKEFYIPFRGYGKYPFLSTSSSVINFDEV